MRIELILEQALPAIRGMIEIFVDDELVYTGSAGPITRDVEINDDVIGPHKIHIINHYGGFKVKQFSINDVNMEFYHYEATIHNGDDIQIGKRADYVNTNGGYWEFSFTTPFWEFLLDK